MCQIWVVEMRDERGDWKPTVGVHQLVRQKGREELAKWRERISPASELRVRAYVRKYDNGCEGEGLAT